MRRGRRKSDRGADEEEERRSRRRSTQHLHFEFYFFVFKSEEQEEITTCILFSFLLFCIFSTNPFCGDMQKEVTTCILNLLNFVKSLSFKPAHLVNISVIQSINELI